MTDTAAAIHIEVDSIEVKSVTHSKGKLRLTIEANDDEVTGEDQLKRITREGFKGLLVIEGQYEQQAIDWSDGAKGQGQDGEGKKP